MTMGMTASVKIVGPQRYMLYANRLNFGPRSSHIHHVSDDVIRKRRVKY